MKKKISVYCAVCGGTDKKHNKLWPALVCPMKKKSRRDRHNAIS